MVYEEWCTVKIVRKGIWTLKSDSCGVVNYAANEVIRRGVWRSVLDCLKLILGGPAQIASPTFSGKNHQPHQQEQRRSAKQLLYFKHSFKALPNASYARHPE
jgi:hypothetical protein